MLKAVTHGGASPQGEPPTSGDYAILANDEIADPDAIDAMIAIHAALVHT